MKPYGQIAPARSANTVFFFSSLYRFLEVRPFEEPIFKFAVVISRTVSSRLEKNLIGAVELNSSTLLPLQADLARVPVFFPALLVAVPAPVLDLACFDRDCF